MDLGGLAERVADLRRRATGERFAILEGKLPSGAPTIATVNLALKRVDHLLLDTHYSVVVRLQEPTPAGLTTSQEGAELNAREDELLAQLGRDAVYIGHETREGTRVLHFHAAAGGPAGALLEVWAGQLSAQGREVELEARHDPGWDVLKRF